MSVDSPDSTIESVNSSTSWSPTPNIVPISRSNFSIQSTLDLGTLVAKFSQVPAVFSPS